MSGQSLGAVVYTSLFAYGLMAVIAFATAGFIAALVAGLAAIGRRAEARVAAVETAAPPAVPATAPAPAAAAGIDPSVVVVIAAAVHAMVGAHRIIWIGETPPMGGWTGEVRQRHHGSHHPHIDH
jgi:hypothetical protein